MTGDYTWSWNIILHNLLFYALAKLEFKSSQFLQQIFKLSCAVIKIDWQIFWLQHVLALDLRQGQAVIIDLQIMYVIL